MKLWHFMLVLWLIIFQFYVLSNKITTFDEYIAKYPDFSYCSSSRLTKSRQAECDLRRTIFDAELKDVQAHNDLNLGWQKGTSVFIRNKSCIIIAILEINKFSILTAKEKKAFLGYSSRHRKSAQQNVHLGSFNQQFIATASSLPANKSVDWRTLNVVTPVKNQGGCGKNSFLYL